MSTFPLGHSINDFRVNITHREVGPASTDIRTSIVEGTSITGDHSNIEGHRENQSAQTEFGLDEGFEQSIQLVAQKLEELINNREITQNAAVQGILGFANEEEKIAVLNGLENGKIKVLNYLKRLFDVTIRDDISRQTELDENVVNVCFINFGYCETILFILSFTKNDVKILYQAHKKDLGMVNIDWEILEYYHRNLYEYCGGPFEKPKEACLKFIENVQEAREVVNGKKEFYHGIYSIEDNHLIYNIYKQDYERLSTSFVDKLRELLQTVKNEIPCGIDSIEVTGDDTKIPFIMEVIRETFRKGPLTSVDDVEWRTRDENTRDCLLGWFNQPQLVAENETQTQEENKMEVETGEEVLIQQIVRNEEPEANEPMQEEEAERMEEELGSESEQNEVPPIRGARQAEPEPESESESEQSDVPVIRRESRVPILRKKIQRKKRVSTNQRWLLIPRIIARSKAKVWKIAVKEWKICYFYLKKRGVCLCSHYPITKRFVLENEITGFRVTLGRVCVKHFGKRIVHEANRIPQGFNRILKNFEKCTNKELIRFSHRKNFITKEEMNCYLDMLSNKLPKSIEKIKHLNKKIIVGYNTSRPKGSNEFKINENNEAGYEPEGSRDTTPHKDSDVLPVPSEFRPRRILSDFSENKETNWTLPDRELPRYQDTPRKIRGHECIVCSKQIRKNISKQTQSKDYIICDSCFLENPLLGNSTHDESADGIAKKSKLKKLSEIKGDPQTDNDNIFTSDAQFSGEEDERREEKDLKRLKKLSTLKSYQTDVEENTLSWSEKGRKRRILD